MEKVQFEKITRNGMKFNFSNGLSVTVIFENEDRKIDLLDCVEELFHCGYVYATVSVIRESFNQAEDLTNYFMEKLAFATRTIKDSAMLSQLLFEVSRYE